MNTCKDAVIFLHIPKTGGTTFHRILERNYKPNQTVTFNGSNRLAEVGRFTKLPESERGRYRLIKGHVSFGLHRFVPGKSTYVTFLRHPVARVISFFYYARSQPDHYLYQTLTEQGVDLKALLKQGKALELFNFQTRLISGAGDSEPALDRTALERAKQNLWRHFHLVGLTEKFDASLFLVRRSLGWDLPFYTRKNVTVLKPPIDKLDAETRALVYEANSLDLELYEFARSLFETKRFAAGGTFESELRHFQRLNGLYVHAHQSFQTMKRGIQEIATSYLRFNTIQTTRQLATDSSV
jgi:hypothetical protein